MEHLKGASLGWTQALLTKIRIGWKGLLGTYTLAYYANSKIRTVKSFITLGPRVDLIKLF